MLGFSTGCLYKSKLTLVEIINLIKDIETDAIELNFGRVDEFLSLSESDLFDITKAISSFKDVSIHAPFRDIEYDLNSRDLLTRLKDFAAKISAKYVVFHPDTIANGGVIEGILGMDAAIENMDKNKLFGKSAVDLDILFRQMPSASFVLDLNHVFTLDSSMKLANIFFEKYQSRIAAYHISGYGDEDALHIGLSHSEEILHAIPDKTIIAIHEGTFETSEQMLSEYVLVKKLIF